MCGYRLSSKSTKDVHTYMEDSKTQEEQQLF